MNSLARSRYAKRLRIQSYPSILNHSLRSSLGSFSTFSVIRQEPSPVGSKRVRDTEFLKHTQSGIEPDFVPFVVKAYASLVFAGFDPSHLVDQIKPLTDTPLVFDPSRPVLVPSENDSPYQIGQETQLLHIIASQFGDGIAVDSNGWLIIVKGANVGDIITANVSVMLQGAARATLLSHLEKSPATVTPKCVHFWTCPGCHFQHIPYNDQLKMKYDYNRDILVANAEQLGETVDSIQALLSEPMVPSRKQYSYSSRLKVIVPKVDPGDKVNSIYVNQYPSGPKEDIKQCQIASSGLKDAYETFRSRRIGRQNIGYDTLHRKDIQLTESIALSDDLIWRFKRLATRNSGKGNSEELSDNGTKIELKWTVTPETKAPHLIEVSRQSLLIDHDSWALDNIPVASSVVSHISQCIRKAVSSRETMDKKFNIRRLLFPDCRSGFHILTQTKPNNKMSIFGYDDDPRQIAMIRQNARLQNFKSIKVSSIETSYDLFFQAHPAEQSMVLLDPHKKGTPYNTMTAMKDWGPSYIIYVARNLPAQVQDLIQLVQPNFSYKVPAKGKANIKGRIKDEKLQEDQIAINVGAGPVVMNRVNSTYKIEDIKMFDSNPQTKNSLTVFFLKRVDMTLE